MCKKHSDILHFIKFLPILFSVCNAKDWCFGKLGLESGHIRDSAIKMSSVMKDFSASSSFPRLNKPGGWCPEKVVSVNSYEWVSVQLGGSHWITGIETQGRFPHNQSTDYTPKYRVEYQRMDESHWTIYTEAHQNQIIEGNNDTTTVKLHRFEQPMIARSVRIVPFSQQPRAVCLRLELRGCKKHDHLESYSMHDGDWLNRNFRFDDVMYDGSREFGKVVNGLGLLNDGVHGILDDQLFDSPKASNGWVGWSNVTRRKPCQQPPCPINLYFSFISTRQFKSVTFTCLCSHDDKVSPFTKLFVWLSDENGVLSKEEIVFSQSDFVITTPNKQKSSNMVDKHNSENEKFKNKKKPKHKITIEKNKDERLNNIEILSNNKPSQIEVVSSQNNHPSLFHICDVTINLNMIVAKHLSFVVEFKNQWLLISEVSFKSANPLKEEAKKKLKITKPSTQPTIFMYEYDKEEEDYEYEDEYDEEGSLYNTTLLTHTVASHSTPSPVILGSSNTKLITFISVLILIFLFLIISIIIIVRKKKLRKDFLKTKKKKDLNKEAGNKGPLIVVREKALELQMGQSQSKEFVYLKTNPNLNCSNNIDQYKNYTSFSNGNYNPSKIDPSNQQPFKIEQNNQTQAKSNSSNYSTMLVENKATPNYTNYYLVHPTFFASLGMDAETLNLSSMQVNVSPQQPSHLQTALNQPLPPIPNQTFDKFIIDNPPVIPPKSLKTHIKEGRKERRRNDSGNAMLNKREKPVYRNLMKEEKNKTFNKTINIDHYSSALKNVGRYLEKHIMYNEENLEVEQKIGKGEFGHIDLCSIHSDRRSALSSLSSPSTSQPLALVLRLSARLSDKSKLKFIEKIKLLSKIKHRNLLCMQGVCYHENSCLSIVMECVPFKDMHQVIKEKQNKRLSELLEFGRQIACGMTYLESIGLVHGDLSARNCLVGKEIKVCDVAKSRKEYQDHYVCLYPPSSPPIPLRWMPWETVLLDEYSNKSDVWSYGVLLWQLFSGEVMPYEGLTNAQVVDNCILQRGEDVDTKIMAHSASNQDPGVYKKNMLYEIYHEDWTKNEDVWKTSKDVKQLENWENDDRMYGGENFENNARSGKKALPGVVYLPRPSHCSSEVYDLMMSCWSCDPNSRPLFDEIHAFMKVKSSGRSRPKNGDYYGLDGLFQNETYRHKDQLKDYDDNMKQNLCCDANNGTKVNKKKRVQERSSHNKTYESESEDAFML